MELVIKGTPDEIKKALQAIAGSEECMAKLYADKLATSLAGSLNTLRQQAQRRAGGQI